MIGEFYTDTRYAMAQERKKEMELAITMEKLAKKQEKKNKNAGAMKVDRDTHIKEISKLAVGLMYAGIPFTFKTLYDGYQIDIDDNFDAICHNLSMGHKSGLLEVMSEKGCDGCLTAQDVLEMLIKR